MATIVPAVTVSTPEDYKASLEKIHQFANHIHVDISDNTFAPVTLLSPSQIWWPQEWMVDIHVMVAQPSQYLAQLVALKPHMITFHAEIEEDLIPLIQQVRASGIRAGVSLMRATVPADVSGALQIADHAMIFSGELGKYGGTASLMQLEKIRLIKMINNGLEIGWDGGITIDNAFSLAQGGVDIFNVGGAIQRSNDPQASYNALVAEINKQGVI